MLSTKLLTLAGMLREPRANLHLIPTIAARLEELSDCVRHLEHSEIPPHLLSAGIVPLPANVVRFPGRAVQS